MPARNGCLVRVEDSAGAFGWGEVWCNFPPRGAQARAHLIEDVIAPALRETSFESWQAVRPTLETRFARMMIHTGEAGAFAQCFAGIDMSVADLCARRAGRSMREFLGGGPESVAVYASTPSTDDRAAQCAELLAAGHRAIKLKVGYAREIDYAAVAACRRAVGPDFPLMVDANQAWDADTAIAQIGALAPLGVRFVEEPLRVDAPLADWRRVAGAVSPAIAAGENIASEGAFAGFIASGGLEVVQPDVAKWGGVSGGLAVGRRAARAGVQCWPHFMGTALGLAASFHLLAALGGPGRVELDVNENPLRTDLGPLVLVVRDGQVEVPPGAGYGFVPDAAALRAMQQG